MKVLVTGGAGFIGANLVHRLSADGFHVTVLDDLSMGLRENLNGIDCELVYGSILDADTVSRCMQGAHATVHLGALGSVPRSIEDPQATHQVNATGTLNVLEFARVHRCQVIFTSSSSVYGANLEEPKSSGAWTQPLSPYGASKLSAESYVLAFGEVYGLDVLVLRLFNVYGPLQRPDHPYSAAIPIFVDRALRGEALTIHGDGEQSRDFTHVDSVVSIIKAALQGRVTSKRPVCAGFGTRVTINEVADELQKQLGYAIPRHHVAPRPGDIYSSRADPSDLQLLFPKAKPQPLAHGLATVLQWMEGRSGRP